MTDYSDLFSKAETDDLIRELNGNIMWQWVPMNPHDTRPGKVSNAPFEAAKVITEQKERIKKLETSLNKLMMGRS